MVGVILQEGARTFIQLEEELEKTKEKTGVSYGEFGACTTSF